MSLREEQCNKVCRILDDVLANRPTERDSLILAVRKAFAEPQERKTGKWQITDAYPHNVYCSECHKRFAQTHWAVWEDGSLPRKFCPNCGCKMEVEHGIC